jgi:hypothetical protein
MGTNCAPLLEDLFIQKFLHEKRKALDVTCALIFPIKLEIKDTTEYNCFGLEILLKKDADGRLITQLYDKRD